MITDKSGNQEHRIQWFLEITHSYSIKKRISHDIEKQYCYLNVSHEQWKTIFYLYSDAYCIIFQIYLFILI